MVKIRKLEDKLYGREIFNVETNAPGFMNITSQNLREDIFSPLSSKRSQFFNKNVIHWIIFSKYPYSTSSSLFLYLLTTIIQYSIKEEVK